MSEVKLSEKEIKSSLKEKKKKKTLKNVLTSSMTEYWPCLKDDQVIEFKEILYRIIKNDESIKNETTLGLQSTLRCISNSKANYVIIDDQINPKWFGKHLIAMTLSKKEFTKIIIIPNLKEVTKQVFSQSAMIFCIKATVEIIDKFYNKLDIHNELLKSYRQIQQSQKNQIVSKRAKKKLKPEVITPIVHLKRSSDEELAFKTTNHSQLKMETEDSDFICLKKYEDKSKATSTYRPMKVKQVLPNFNRKMK